MNSKFTQTVQNRYSVSVPSWKKRKTTALRRRVVPRPLHRRPTTPPPPPASPHTYYSASHIASNAAPASDLRLRLRLRLFPSLCCSISASFYGCSRNASLEPFLLPLLSESRYSISSSIISLNTFIIRINCIYFYFFLHFNIIYTSFNIPLKSKSQY